MGRPFRRSWREAVLAARRRALRSRLYLRDLVLPTYGTFHGTRRLERIIEAPDPGLIAPSDAEAIASVAQHYLDHRFDLLGSGWVRVRHGMVCRGLEGCRYTRPGRVVVDSGGRWLTGRINHANVREAMRVWRLVDADYDPIDWQVDFKSGWRWSEAQWYRAVPRRPASGADIKVPWELARGQHFPQLALAFGLARAGATDLVSPDRCAREFRNQVLDFIATNPPRFGVNWCNTMEVAIRVANWLVAWDLFNALGARFDEAFEGQLVRSVLDHGRHIAANLEWAERIRGNHYLANIVGLLFAAAYLPPDEETDAWLALAVQELIHEVEFQFLPDGANFEASTSYHRFSAELVAYATAMALAVPPERIESGMARPNAWRGVGPRLRPRLQRRTDEADRRALFPRWYIERLERMAEFCTHVTAPGAGAVQIGDNDSGRFLKLRPALTRLSVEEARDRLANLDGYDELPSRADYWLEDPLDHRSTVAALNGFFRRPDLGAFAAGARWEEELVSRLAGITFASYRRSGEPSAAERVRIGAPGDLQRLRDRLASDSRLWRTEIEIEIGEAGTFEEAIAYPDFGLFILRGSRAFLSFRCGPVGQKGNGGHAHNDQLSITLVVDAVPWIADPGSYLYTPFPEIRNRYRSVVAHFAPRPVHGEPASLDEGLFRLADPGARCFYFGSDGCAGMHCGYGEPVYRLVRILGRTILIEDFTPFQIPQAVVPRRIRSPADVPVDVPYSPGYGCVLRGSAWRHPIGGSAVVAEVAG
mgnify:CR=1 FL=1|jgi:hypothetical protein